MRSLGKFMRSWNAFEQILRDGQHPTLATDATVVSTGSISELLRNHSNNFFTYRRLLCNASELFDSFCINGHSIIRNGKAIDPSLLHTLKMHSKAASFGRGSETVYDPSIRKALEIQSQDCQFVFSDKMQQVQVQLNRLASEGYQLIPKFYKIHVYEQGGHFDMHRDALHAENHFGTLVVGLSEIGFTGGEFVLLVNGKEMRIDTNRESVCFLTDLEHRVDQVTSGCRVTFQFDLYLEDISEMEDEEDDCWELDDSASNGRDAVWKYKPDYVPKLQVEKLPETPSSENLLEIHKQLVIQLKDYLALNPSKSVSILLLHRYPREMSVDLLKASDKDLYLLLKQHFRLNLGFCVHNIYDFHSQPDPYHDHYRVINFELAERLKAYLDTGDFEQHAPNETHLFVGYGATFNKQHLSKYVEFTGNESQADVYAYQAFTLNVK